MDFNVPEDLKMVQTLVRDFVKNELIAREREILGREGEPSSGRSLLQPETLNQLKKMVMELGLWAVNTPEEWGGIGLNTLGNCLVAEETAKSIIPFDFGEISPILFECNAEQREKYLSPLVQGEKTCSISLIEATGTQSATDIKTIALKKNGHFVLNGQKLCLSIYGFGDFSLIFALTSPDSQATNGTTCFIVDSSSPGLMIEDKSNRLGWSAQVIEPTLVALKDCRVPAENVIGELNGAFHLGKKWLPGRRLVRSAKCVGAAQRLLEVSSEYAKMWQSFGRLISEMPAIQHALADMLVDITAGRLMVYYGATKADEGEEINLNTAMVKIYAAEMLKRTADRAVLIHGGPAYSPGLKFERLYRNAISAFNTELALELQRNILTKFILTTQ